jgi:hypothetical protein
MLSLAAAVFMWPGLLQTENLPARAEHLQVLGPAQDSGPGGVHAAGPARRIARGIPHLNVPAPNFGALREGPASLPFNTFASLDPTPLANPELLEAVSNTPQTPPGQPAVPFVLPDPTGPRPEPDSFVGGPGPTGPNPPTNPPITNPPDPVPPVVGPPVDPGNPPVTPPVSPPDGPPPVVTPTSPPLTNPDPPPVVVPNQPFSPPFDPGGPGGGGPGDGGPGGKGGDNPQPSGAPEPGVWLDLVLGAALAGASLRRQRRQPAMALRAVSRA